MTTLTIAEISAGLAIGHTLKAFIEVNNANTKVKRLSEIVHNRSVKPYPVNINTRLKAYSSLFGFYVVLSVISFFVLRWLNPTLRTTIWIAAAALLIGEVVYLVGLDKYHVNIGKLTKFLTKKLKT
ncbi:MAG TPA: hypothetical protein VGF75_06620 [Candidatus Saccharimonadales bacterium]|jgi:hypothetical protein